jgi:hypothetical protein
MTEPTFTAEFVEEVAEALRGSCETLRAVLDIRGRSTLEDDVEFCRALDDRVFCCEQCSWWHLLEEESTEMPGHCEECAPSEEDDE